jgi:DNA-binding transcriptional LysR family regulator
VIGDNAEARAVERWGNMLVRHLSYFVTLAREKHFARAADACNVTQPTLSAAIRKLEDYLETPLIIRGHRFLGLTPGGEKALLWGQQILADYQNMCEDLSGMRRGLSGLLRLGVVPAAMPSVSFLTARFCAAHPAATVEIRAMTSRSIQRGLEAFEIDAGLTYLENEVLENVRRTPLYRERYILVTHSASKLASRKTITWAEAAQERLCLLSDDMQNRRIIDNVFHSLGLAIKPAVVSNSYLAVCAHLRHGGWASILPHTFLYIFAKANDLATIGLVGPEHSQEIGLVLSSRDPPSPMANALRCAILGSDFDAELAAVGPS